MQWRYLGTLTPASRDPQGIRDQEGDHCCARRTYGVAAEASLLLDAVEKSGGEIDDIRTQRTGVE